MIDIRDLRFRWPRADADTLVIDRLAIDAGEAVFLYGHGVDGERSPIWTTGR